MKEEEKMLTAYLITFHKRKLESCIPNEHFVLVQFWHTAI